MLGKEKNKYKAYVKLINKCLFHTLQKYTDDKISYNNTEELIKLFHKYNITFNREVWADFVEVCKTQKAFKNLTYTYEQLSIEFLQKDACVEYIMLKRKNDFAESVIDTPITTLDFELLNQENGILYLQRVMLYYLDTWRIFRKVREYIKINPFDK
jgi:hypothetical protein